MEELNETQRSNLFRPEFIRVPGSSHTLKLWCSALVMFTWAGVQVQGEIGNYKQPTKYKLILT